MTAPAPARRRGRGLAVAFILLALLAVLAIAGGGFFLYARAQLDAPDGTHDHIVTVDVRSGETIDQLSSDLQSRGLVRSSFWFGWFARFKGLAGQLRAGRFKLDTGMGASAVVARLEGAPDVAVIHVVLAEGLTAAQMARRIADSGVGVTADQYLTEVRGGRFDEPFLAGRPPGGSLEGFLFPDTYEFARGTTAHQIVQAQLDDFGRRAGALLQSPPKGMNAYQVVIVASIVEREARFADDQPKVASAIDNRLAANMPLQADSAVAYGLGITDREPTADELKLDTPYNTYLHAGLTPTPISNPGLASIRAAAQPATTNWLFWVADGCGHNHYATTLPQHEQQVQQYVGASCPSSTP